MQQFTVGGVNYRVDAQGNIQYQHASGQWLPYQYSGTDPQVDAAAKQAQAQLGQQVVPQNTLDKLAKTQGPNWTISPGAKPAPYVNKDGIPVADTYTIMAIGPNGEQRLLTVTAKNPTPGPTPGLGDPRTDKPDTVDWGAPIGVEEVVKAPTQTPEEKNAAVAAANAATELAKQQLTQLQNDEAERIANEKAGDGRVTNKEKATLDQMKSQTGVSEGQLKLAQAQFEQNGQLAQANLKIAQGQLEVAQLNQRTAEDRAKIDARLADNTIDKTQADKELAALQFAWQKEFDARQQNLRELTQQQQNVIQTGQLQVSQQQLAQNAAQAQQTAETAARGQNLQAATSMYGTEKQAKSEAAKTGESLLQARAGTAQQLINEPFSAAASLSRPSAGKYGPISGGGVAIPSGVIGGLVSGAQGLATAMYGGQPSIDAAIQAIQNIRPGAPMGPMEAAAAALFSQITDQARKAAGVGTVTGPNTNNPAAANQAVRQNQNTPIAAPQTVTPLATTPGPTNTLAVPNFNTLGPIAGTPGIGGPNAYGATPFPFAQSDQTEGSNRYRIRAPTTAPQVNLYIGGGG